jgi:8-oxo-dGTP pyrophosphatase MutT (NUDIX family)
MAKLEIEQNAIRLGEAGKTDVRTQFGALCYRVQNGELQFCLITSRGTGRWIVPKGWPVDGATPTEAAATEAWEEAGLEGRVRSRPLGVYSYYKSNSDDALPCVAVIFPLKVKKAHSRWPERKERKRRWVNRRKAAKMVDEPELRQMILRFDPKLV